MLKDQQTVVAVNIGGNISIEALRGLELGLDQIGQLIQIEQGAKHGAAD